MHVCMYVCMHACICVCVLHACMCVTVFAFMYLCIGLHIYVFATLWRSATAILSVGYKWRSFCKITNNLTKTKAMPLFAGLRACFMCEQSAHDRGFLAHLHWRRILFTHHHRVFFLCLWRTRHGCSDVSAWQKPSWTVHPPTAAMLQWWREQAQPTACVYAQPQDGIS